jgi:ketosteroid isomerase-like protein
MILNRTHSWKPGLLALGLALLCSSCSSQDTETTAVTAGEPDYEAELALIEETRSAFQVAIRSGRYDELGRYVTPDFIAVAPGSADWELMFQLGADRATPFPYDSISMRPIETVVVSDSVAWDFGVSAVYYTDEEGAVQQLSDTFLAIIKKGADGVWRLHREVASSRVQ